MNRWLLATGAVCFALGAAVMEAQTARVIPRPPAQVPGVQPPGESAAPDGYAPIPQWLGQTRAPVPSKTAAYDVETVAEGLIGAFCFHFLPDGRIIVGERRSSAATCGLASRTVCGSTGASSRHRMRSR